MKSRRVVPTARAEEDLIEIWLHVAQDDMGAADRLLNRIEVRWQQLGSYPLSGVGSDGLGEGIRHLVESNYLIFYRTGSTTVEIVRVLHGKRDIAPADLIEQVRSKPVE